MSTADGITIACDTREVNREMLRYAALANKSAQEITREAARRFSRQAIKYTPPFNSPGGRRKQQENWRTLIIERRHQRRKGRYYLEKRRTGAYLRTAKKLQGMLAAGFYPAAAATKAAGIPAIVKRHGNAGGSYTERSDAAGTTATVTFNKRAEFFAKRALEKTKSGLAAGARNMLSRAIRNAARRGR